MKKSSVSRRIAMVVVGMMCLSTVFIFGAGSDSLSQVEGAPLGTSQVGSAAVQTAIDQATTPAADTVAAVMGAAAPASASLPATAAAPAVVDDDNPGSAATDASVSRITPPYGLEGKFAPEPDKPFVYLAWASDNPPSILREYNIYRVETGTSADIAPSPGKPYASTKKTEFEDYGIKPGMTYRYWVTAVSKRGEESGASNTVDVETVPVTEPSAPTGLAAYQNDPGVSLDWDPGKEAGIAGYSVYFSKNLESKRYLVNEELAPANHFYDKGGNVKYYYWVSAVNRWGLESKAAMVVPAATKPAVFQENDPSVTTDGTWKVENYVGPTDGKIIVAGDTGSSLKFNFTGSQVKMTVAKYWSCGSAHVYIDGQLVATVNEYSEATTYNVISLNVPGLVHGNHTLTVEALGAGNPTYPYNFVNVDSFEVR